MLSKQSSHLEAPKRPTIASAAHACAELLSKVCKPPTTTLHTIQPTSAFVHFIHFLNRRDNARKSGWRLAPSIWAIGSASPRGMTLLLVPGPRRPRNS